MLSNHKTPPKKYSEQYKWLCENNLIVSEKEACAISGINIEMEYYHDKVIAENLVVGTTYWFNENKKYAIAPEGYYWKALYNEENRDLFNQLDTDFYATSICMEFGLAKKRKDYKPYKLS